ncbi:two pore domain potassium channel family protein [Candidatus Woesearchaeota archaeon]|nr:two pore domain potassium channel family protein [Candidatus Woesearchaeota archaeon]
MVDTVGKKLLRIIDRATIKEVFLFWIVFMIVMGMVYFFLTFFSGDILYRGKIVKPSFGSFFLMQYFSFITSVSASQGYGDIFPLGIARVFAVFEAVTGLLLFGMLIAKLVSVKQEVILEEVYAISHDEQLSRVRATINQFTIDMNKVMDKVHQGMITKRSIKESWVHFYSLSKALQDLNQLIFNPKRESSEYVKTLDFNQLDLLIVGITSALQKTVQFFELVDQRKLELDRVHVAETLSTIYGSIKLFADHYQRLPELREQFTEVLALLDATKNLLNKYTGYKKYI